MSVIQRVCEEVYSSFASSAFASASTVETKVPSRLSKLRARCSVAREDACGRVANRDEAVDRPFSAQRREREVRPRTAVRRRQRLGELAAACEERLVPAADRLADESALECDVDHRAQLRHAVRVRVRDDPKVALVVRQPERAALA